MLRFVCSLSVPRTPWSCVPIAVAESNGAERVDCSVHIATDETEMQSVLAGAEEGNTNLDETARRRLSQLIPTACGFSQVHMRMGE